MPADCREVNQSKLKLYRVIALLLMSPVVEAGAQEAPPFRVLDRVPRSDDGWTHTVSPSGRFIIQAHKDSLFIRHIPDRRRIFLATGSADDFAWSARSHRLAWIKYEAERVGYVWTVSVDPATGRLQGAPQRVSVTAASKPSVSADGNSIAFVGKKQSAGAGDIPLHVIPATGGPAREVARLQSVDALMWSPDGRSIYLSGSINNPRGEELLQLYLDGRSPRQVPKKKDHWVIGLSADGTRFALASYATRQPMLVVTDTLGNELGAAPLPTGNVFQFEGVLGDSAVVWATARESRSLTAHSVANRSRRNLARVGESDLFGVYAPDGKHIAHMALKNGANAVVIRDADGARARQFAGTDARADAFSLRWSPDSRYVGFVSKGGTEFRTIEAATGTVRTVVRDSVLRFGNWAWRADSRGVNAVMLAGNDLSKSSIEQVQLDGTRTKIRQLSAMLTEQIKGFRWLNDTLIVVRHDTAVFLRTLRDGSARLISRVPVGYNSANVVTSLDDRIIVTPIRKGDELGKLEVLSTDGNRREIPLPIWFLAPATPRLSADNRMAYVAGRTTSDPLGSNIYAIATDGSSVQRVATITGTVPQASFDLSPDGKTLLYPSIVDGTSTLYIVPFAMGTPNSRPSSRR